MVRLRWTLRRLEDRLAPAALVVTAVGDSGVGTLRSTLAIANSNAQADTITFAAGITNISLTSGQLAYTENYDLTVVGPGVTVRGATSASATNRILDVATTGTPLITLSGLTLADANLTGSDGAAIRVKNEPLLLSAVTLTNNKTNAAGGAIATTANGAKVTIINSTVSANQSTHLTEGKGGGGLFLFGTATVTITNSTFSNNSASNGGGAIYTNSAILLAIDGCKLTNNSTAGSGAGKDSSRAGGGALFFANSSTTVTINASTVSGNSSGDYGGAIYFWNGGNATFTASTFAGNIGLKGGAITTFSASLTIIDCTLSNNTSTGSNSGGGAILMVSGATVAIRNSTLAGNTAAGSNSTGGGIFRMGGSLTIDSSILGDNTATAGGLDINTSSNVIGTNNLIESTFGYALAAPGFNFTGVDPALSPLSDNGGPTQTQLLKAGSPAIDAGSNIAPVLPYDQRGIGFSRTLNGLTDIGAIESATKVPVATVTSSPTVAASGATPYTFTVLYTDAQTNIDLTTLKTGTLRIDGPKSFVGIPSYVSNSGAGKSVIATYRLNAADLPDNGVGDSWDPTDNGVYTISIVGAPNAVRDSDVPANAVPVGLIGSFTVAVPATYVVNTLTDELDPDPINLSDLSLREAIYLANTAVGVADSITFAAATSGKTFALTLGALDIADPVTITGIGNGQTTISGGGLSRVFSIDAPGIGAAVTLAHLTIRDGNVTDENGAGIRLLDDALTLTSVVLAANTANGTGAGGAIAVSGAASITIVNSIIAFNSAASHGGGLFFTGNDTITLAASSVNDNIAGGDGGGLAFLAGGQLRMDESTVSGNTSAGTFGGGGLYFWGPTDSFVISNSTFSGNTASIGAGGAIDFVGLSGSPVIRNTTITRNRAAVFAGGVHRETGDGLPTIVSSILAQNTNLLGTGTLDLSFSTSVTLTGSTNNLFSVCDLGNFKLVGTNVTGTAVKPLDARLLALAANGGPTKSHLPASGSPVRNQGANPAGLMIDQRGQTRVAGAVVDIGSVESSDPAPIAVVVGAPTVSVAGATPYTIQIAYTDEQSNINLATLKTGNIRVDGPATFIGTPVYISNTGAGKSVTVTYRLNAADLPDNTVVDAWDASDNGTYTISIVGSPNAVLDSDAVPNAVFAGQVGSFQVAIPTTYVVNTATDESDPDPINLTDLSLREALYLANATKGVPDTITFAASLSGLTLSLPLGELAVTDGVTIVGPGAKLLTLSATAERRHFNIDDATTDAIAVSVSGLKLTGGNPLGDGGSILTAAEQLTLEGVWLTGNLSTTSGGAVAIAGGGKLTLTNSTLAGNSAQLNGGGIYFPAGGNVIVRNSTLSGNIALDGYGGGIAAFNWYAGSSLLVQNTTITGNSASYAGGGIRSSTNGVPIVLQSSIVTDNTASSGPDIFAAQVDSTNNLFGTLSGFVLNDLAGTATGTAMLAALADNGGPTPTHALLLGSPATNAGFNPAGLTMDQRGVARVIGGAADLGAFETTALPPTATVKIDAGTNQRSLVRSLTVTFSEVPLFPTGAADAFVLTRLPTSSKATPTGAVTLSATVAGNVVTLTWSDPTYLDPAAPLSKSLIDGRYSLTIKSGNALGLGGGLDGNGDGVAGDDKTINFYRLFGDGDGDADADNADFIAFRTAFGAGPSVVFDYDQDGDVDNADFIAFRSRFGGSP